VQILNRFVVVALAGGLMTAGCATSSDEVAPSYVALRHYNDYTCTMLRTEAQRVSTEAMALANLQDARYREDRARAGVATAMMVPALLSPKGNDTNTWQLARLKGELDVIRTVAAEKKCGIQFEDNSRLFYTPKPRPANDRTLVEGGEKLGE
jgi:hypothetical protein